MCHYFATMTIMIKKLLFLGTPDFAVPMLEAVIQHQAVNTFAVITRPDAPKGRSKKLVPSPVKQCAIKHNLPVFNPPTKETLSATIQSLSPDIIIVVAYGMILPKIITDTYFCINSHGSLLPQYRGASPIHASLLNHDKKTGITLIKMDEKMDTGDILYQQKITIDPQDNFASLHDKLAILSGTAIITYLETMTDVTPVPQNHQTATYCKKYISSDFELNTTDSALINLGKIRAFSPVPGAYIIKDKKRVKILHATLENNKLKLITVKPEGKQAMSYQDYCLGNPPLDTLTC
jgi:methionyl-tRNA formyltransferase